MPDDLYDRYADAVEDPRTERTCRTYLSKLERYNPVDAEGEGRSCVYMPAE